ncbi:MAG: SGNH/GDSL hydrolase family protein [Arenimonas sp.]
MPARLAALLLSPVLLAQALHVRRHALRLPEADGVRTGHVGDGTPLSLLILGDSAAAGVGAGSQQQALAGQLAARLAAAHRLDWTLWAKSGRASRQVLALLEREEARPFDVALTSIGVNDITGGVRLSAWLVQQARIRAVLRTKFGVRRIVLTAVPPMQHFRALPQPLRWVLGERVRRFNQALRRSVSGEADVRMLPVVFPAGGDYLAEDGFHPNAAAYALWAQQAAALIAGAWR